MPENYFPIECRDNDNPALKLFGSRFFHDQIVPEHLIEFLLVVSTQKRINGTELPKGAAFPDASCLHTWPAGYPLEYAPKARLNLKLLSFLGSSRLETRHETHRQQFKQLLALLRRSERLAVAGSLQADEVVKTIESLFAGFRITGTQRTWCTTSFLPIIPEVIACETIWQHRKAVRNEVGSWAEAQKYFLYSQHDFLARGGELLYLQLCNAFRHTKEEIAEWAQSAGVSLADREKDPDQLREALGSALLGAVRACPPALGEIASFIDTGLESDTARMTDGGQDTERFTSCGYCPTDTWPEAVLFGAELLRLCEAALDPIERLSMLEIACALQILRTLCAQSSRHCGWIPSPGARVGPLGFLWVLSDPVGSNGIVKQISRRSVIANQQMIRDAVHNSGASDGEDEGADLKQIDARYGHKLFTSLGKRIGFIVPNRGAGARFVLNERLLRFMVLATIRPGERVRYQTFKSLLFAHYGLLVDGSDLGCAGYRSQGRVLTSIGDDVDAWLKEMLNAAGVMVHLSDAFSFVENPFGNGRQ